MQYVVPPLVGNVPVYIVFVPTLLGGTKAPLHTAPVRSTRAAEAFTSLAGAQAATAAAAGEREATAKSARKAPGVRKVLASASGKRAHNKFLV